MLKNILIFVSLVVLAIDGNSISKEAYKSQAADGTISTEVSEDKTDAAEGRSESENKNTVSEDIDIVDGIKSKNLTPEELDMLQKINKENKVKSESDDQDFGELEAMKETEVTTKDSFDSEKKIQLKKAEEELKVCIKNLNCSKSKMGFMRCLTLKKISKKFYNNPNRDPAKMKPVLVYFFNKMQASNQLDPELAKWAKKYEHLKDARLL